MCYETLRVHLGLAIWLHLSEIPGMRGLGYDRGGDLMTNSQHVLVPRSSLLVLYHHDKIGTTCIPQTDCTPSGVHHQTIDFACWVQMQMHCISERGKEQR